MEAGALFIVFVLLVFLAVAGGIVWLLASTLRRRKLNPQEDKIDSVQQVLHGERSRNGHAGQGAGEQRPEHQRVRNEQGSRSIPQR